MVGIIIIVGQVLNGEENIYVYDDFEVAIRLWMKIFKRWRKSFARWA